MCGAAWPVMRGVACMSHGPNSRLHFFWACPLFIYLLYKPYLRPHPCAGIDMYNKTKEDLLLECPYLFMMPCSLPVHSGIISMFLFGFFFFLEQWLAQTDFHIKNRGGGDAYVWGAAICALMLATVSWLMWKTKYSFFSVFLFFF